MRSFCQRDPICLQGYAWSLDSATAVYPTELPAGGNAGNLQIYLEALCEQCKGKGDVPDSMFDDTRIRKNCSNCDGTGVQLTEQGKSLLKFVMTHLQSNDSKTLVVKNLS